ncbi:MAG: CocE/NonD family hydrolase [Chthoniobacter sp.]
MRYYVMGAAGEPGAPGNYWREAQDFPPQVPGTPLYLRADGGWSAPCRPDVSSHTSYASNPRQPMSIPGTPSPGRETRDPSSGQSEVRTWTTAPLAAPIEWTGEVQAEIFASSTAKDTDFILRVSDVYPDGRSMLLMDYPLRARYPRRASTRKCCSRPASRRSSRGPSAGRASS